MPAASLVCALLVFAQTRTIAIDDKLAHDLGIRIGDRVVVTARPGGAGDTVMVSAILAPAADPSEVAFSQYRIRMHLDQLQRISGYDDRVGHFAVATRSEPGTLGALRAINAEAFGFQAYRSRDVAVETSKTFQVVSRFHRAIGIITIVASAIFLLCIMLLKVDERRRDVAALRMIGISRTTVVKGVVTEAAALALLGSALGVGMGWVMSLVINWHYQGVYRTALTFSFITADIVAFAVALSIVLGIGAGVLASLRLVRQPPLNLFGR